MTTMEVRLRSVPDTSASLGWAGAHTVMVDRPEGKAGGQGLGFNGGQLLGLAIGGCLCNDLHYVADRLGIEIKSLSVDVTVTFGGDPLLATDAFVQVAVEPHRDDADVDELIRAAVASSTVSNSISRGVPVRVARHAGTGASR